MEQTGNLKSLAERMKEKAEQERLETERIFTEQLQTLSSNLQALSQNALNTMSDAMAQAITNAAETLNQRYRLLSFAFSKQWLSMTILGIFLCLGMMLGGWSWVELVKSEVEQQRKELARLTAAYQDHLEAVEILKTGTWGLTLQESEKGRFIVLPPGKTIDLKGNWKVGNRQAIRLEE